MTIIDSVDLCHVVCVPFNIDQTRRPRKIRLLAGIRTDFNGQNLIGTGQQNGILENQIMGSTLAGSFKEGPNLRELNLMKTLMKKCSEVRASLQ